MNERCGEYELIRYLTAGGMADLWLARSPKHDDDLVVKRIQPRFLEFTRVVKMFIDEGRIAQALEHPNIVRIVDVGQELGAYYIAMEYIPGRDLLEICRQGIEVGRFLPRHLAVAILVQALRGLQHAHEKTDPDGTLLKVVHCDISPGNIVVSWGGTVKIVDFGISRATIQLRTEDHTVAGKYNYMAPEQIRGEEVDARADLFAIGILLYELTVGKRLFRGRPEQVMRLVIEEPIPRPTEVRDDFPAELERIIMKALDRDPNHRYQTARSLRGALKAWLQSTGQPHGKREIATYLRDIFRAEKTTDAEDFAPDPEDEELVLEKGLPTSASGMHILPLEVDPEEPEEGASGTLPLVDVEKEAQARAGAEARAAQPAGGEPVVVPLQPPPTSPTPAPAPARAPEPDRSRGVAPPPAARTLDLRLVVGAVVALALAAAAYYLLGS